MGGFDAARMWLGMAIRARSWVGFVVLLLASSIGGCGFILRHTTNVTAAPDVEVVSLPSYFQLDQSKAKPGEWVLIASNSARSTPAGTEPFVFDLSPFLGLDPYLGPWNPPLPTEQKVFVKASEAARVRMDRDGWNERFVI